MSIVDHAINFELKGEKLHRHVEKEAVKISTNNLLSFPWIKDRVVSGGLKIHGWWFDLEAGDLLSYSEKTEWGSLLK